MAFEKLGATPLDYMPCRYGTSKLLFRGPARDPRGRYVAFLGGTETYGKFIRRPFPALVEERCGLPCINLGWPNAGLDVLLHDSAILPAASGAALAVVQVPGAQNLSNRYFTVHPRRNDRFVKPSVLLRAIYPEVDFTEFHFTRHMLGHLADLSPERFAPVRRELQQAWRARMRLLLTRIDAPVLLLWLAPQAAPLRADLPGPGAAPAFVTRAMLEAPGGACVRLVELAYGEAALGGRGMAFSPFEAQAAAELPGPGVHALAADALMPALREALGA
ncbi:DUF6473 family protein [Roseovarius aquimarinus]|uniref:DUF6473 family protein n=1 Tax=Roseovarius aquimarinus TaxID=1229156 RepID=A0ABW7I7C9_9RHOB